MDKWVLAGVGYLTATRRDDRRQKLLREIRVTMQQTPPEDPPSGPDEPARDPGNRSFVLELSSRLDSFEQVWALLQTLPFLAPAQAPRGAYTRYMSAHNTVGEDKQHEIVFETETFMSSMGNVDIVRPGVCM